MPRLGFISVWPKRVTPLRAGYRERSATNPQGLCAPKIAMKPRISVITLGVNDLERAVAFYRDGLGLLTEGIVGTQYENGAVAFFEMQAGLKLALWPRKSLAADAGLPLRPSSATEMALAHNVASESEVRSVMAKAQCAGAKIIKEPGPAFWGGYTGCFQDPDGHLWEIAFNPNWPLPQE